MTDYRNSVVGVIYGGPGSEREVSINSGNAVIKALRGLGYDVRPIDLNSNTPAVLAAEEVDVVFNALHGKYGEDGAVQGLLEIMGIPYTGSGVTASAVAMDKLVSKNVFEKAGVPTLPYLVMRSTDEIVEPPFGFPAVVKPQAEGSSVGISIVENISECKAALLEALKYDRAALVEKYIKGVEVQAAILGQEVLGEVEVEPGESFYDYKAKYHADPDNPTRYYTPARISINVRERSHRAALDAHNCLGCSGYSRVDMIAESYGQIWVLEVNTLPGLTEKSLLPKIADGAGINFPALVEKILSSARLNISAGAR